ncbi:MAG: hypothetical protein ACRCZI_00195 [Cetobacterium sp.]
MSSILNFTYSIKDKLNIFKREAIEENQNLKEIPHYKLFKYLNTNISKKDNESETILEKARQKSKIIDFTLKYVKER